jgi:hypothetical protein
VSSPARGHARARERGAEAPPGFDGALRGSQVILGVGGEPEEAGEAATIGHANQRAGRAPTGACSQAFSAVGYLFLGATGELRAGRSDAIRALALATRTTRVAVMRILLVALVLSALCGCNTLQGDLDELRAASGGFVRGGDTYGTSRRPDLYGRSTQPTTPSIGTR